MIASIVALGAMQELRSPQLQPLLCAAVTPIAVPVGDARKSVIGGADTIR